MLVTLRLRIGLGLALVAATAGAVSWWMVPRKSSARSVSEGMVWIPGGTFQMGCADCGMPDAMPVHAVTVDGFWMEATPVTNARFAQFVEATGYITVAERKPEARDLPGVAPEDLVPGSAVFIPPKHNVALDDISNWWSYVRGANWRHPEGPASDLRNRMDHPVVHIAYEDAEAFAHWAHGRLPTEAEFEFAARGGLDGKRYAWGDELKPGGRYVANIFQGQFPNGDTGEDGYIGTSPVQAFPPNAYGLYDMSGNVWQWTSDWYRPDTYASRAGTTVRNPTGPESSLDPQEPGTRKKVQRGGSFLCSEQYCRRYLVGSRGKGEIRSASSNLSFRLVRPR
ncbi:MAG TPA: formylglycine-generating enzyme family protein [Bryobacteraceae bacterium]|nr:formylglycine-generating enzyme family protein [Bryobacteraceae bacterium]